jgi:hypothetical protein
MSTGGPFPTKNIDFNSYILIAIPYLATNAARLGVSTEHNDALAALLLLWTPIFTQCENSALATTASREKRDLYRQQFESILRDVYNDIPASALTIDDRQTLHLPERDTNPTPSEVPNVAPVVTVIKNIHLQHTLRFQNPDTPDSSAKPAGVASVEMYVYLVDNNVPPPPFGPNPTGQNFYHLGGTGKFLHTVNFTDGDEGKVAYYVARYRNTRGVLGPPSVMQFAVIG